MRFTLFNIGKTDTSYLILGIADYCNRIKHFIDFSVIDIPGIKSGNKMPPEIVKKKEGEALLKVLSTQDVVILLDEKGTEMNSLKFAEWFNKFQ